MICNFVCAAPWGVFPLGLVKPVELGGIRRGRVAPTRGTGGTGFGCCRVKIFMYGSTGPTDRFRQDQQNGLQYHRFHLVVPKRDGCLPRRKISLWRLMSIS